MRAAVIAGVLVAAPCAFTVTIPSVALATTSGKWGYVDANDPTATNYTPTAVHQKQSNGQHVTVHRSGAGVYEVTFHGLAGGSNFGIVQVTAYYPATCQTDGWGAVNGNIVATVLCFTPGGGPSDSEFDATYALGAGSRAFAYAWDSLSSSSGPLSSGYSFDGKGGQISSTHNGPGDYTVSIPHLAGSGGTVKVTADGSSEALCSVGGWGGGNVRVLCTNAAGVPTDTDFGISFASRLSILGVPRTSGYLWNSSLNSDYTDTDSYRYNSAGGTIVVRHPRTGEYIVYFSGFAQSRGHLQVTSYGSNPNVQCESAGWGPGVSGSEEYVAVDCYDVTSGDTAVDSLFTAQFTL